MRERKIYSVLVLLTKEEQQRFGEYLVSPLFEPSQAMQRFFRIWQEKMLDVEEGDERDFSPEEFLEGSGLIPARIDKYCSALYKKVLDFLAFEQYLKSEGRQIENAADALEQRNAPRKEWDSQRERLQQSIDSMGDSSEKYLRQLQFKWKDTEARVHTRETQNIWKEDFRGLHQAIDRYYLLQKLKLECAAANARMIFNQPQDPAEGDEGNGLAIMTEWNLDAVKSQLDALSYSYWLTLRLYNSNDGTEEFDAIFDHLQKESSRFGPVELEEVYNYVLNYCLRRGNRGEARFQQYSAALYRELLAKKIILTDGKLPPQAMKNIVVINCMVGELDWVAGFLEEYKDLLQGDPDPNVIKYNQAVLAFYQQDRDCIPRFREVISQLKDDVFYELDARIYLLKAYFQHHAELDLQEIDDMYRMYDSVRIFISRNEMISPMKKQGYRNFITQLRKFLKLLETAGPAPDQSRLRRLSQKVSEEKFMANRSWLVEKINFYLEPA